MFSIIAGLQCSMLEMFNQRSRTYGAENMQAPSSSSNSCQQPLATLLCTYVVFWIIGKQVAYIWHCGVGLESVDVPWATWKSLQSAVSTKSNRAGHIDGTRYFIQHFNKPIKSVHQTNMYLLQRIQNTRRHSKHQRTVVCLWKRGKWEWRQGVKGAQETRAAPHRAKRMWHHELRGTMNCT